jgi:hypothetical protein
MPCKDEGHKLYSMLRCIYDVLYLHASWGNGCASQQIAIPIGSTLCDTGKLPLCGKTPADILTSQACA